MAYTKSIRTPTATVHVVEPGRLGNINIAFIISLLAPRLLVLDNISVVVIK